MTTEPITASALLSPPAPPVPPAPPAAQQPQWPDPAALAEVVEGLAGLPGLTTRDECGLLRAELAAAARGDGLVLHGGDCAERFEDSAPGTVLRKAAQLRALADRMREETGLARATAIGRIAGQYAKPRSEEYETGADGVRMHSYRGDAVNSPEAAPTPRVPDPARLLGAYQHAARALTAVRESWRGLAPGDRVFVSHELLLLPFERALLGADGHALSTHFGWIGERTRQLDGAHVALAAAVRNPVGVKLGPGVTPETATELVRRLNPDGEEGRLTLIARMGAGLVEERLPAVAQAVAATGVPVVWLCDPMHGNTVRTPGGAKTRLVPDVRDEVTGFVKALRSAGAVPGGLSLELTPDPVTECLDGAPAGPDRDLFPDYRSTCDPRLNPAQAEAVVQSFLAAL